MPDAKYTGNQISSARKKMCFTQKQLAEKLMVTDKAVSKWERGINYPDIALLKPLSEILGISIVQLLCEEDTEKAVEITTEISLQEKAILKRNLKWRWLLVIVITVFVMIAQIYISYVLAQAELYGLPQVLTSGLLPLQGLIIGIAIFSLINIKKA